MTFKGTFFKDSGSFEKGRLSFRDGESFKGIWESNGDVSKGYIITYDKSKMYIGSEDLVRRPWGKFSGKVISKRDGKIYEGGLTTKGDPKGLGFTVVNREHKMFMQNQYNDKGKMHGRQVFDYLYWGFRTEEYYTDGKPCGIWRYKTCKGYEYIYEVGAQKQIVRFPFLTKDYYKGEVEIWCD